MRKLHLKHLTGLCLAFTLAADTQIVEIQPADPSLVPISATAQAQDVYMRVVDVGNALCVVIKIPGGHSMLYDAGNYNTDECLSALRDIIGEDKLDLVVLSHSDADHIGELPGILPAYPPQQLVYTGRKGTSERLWPRVIKAIDDYQKAGHAVRNLETSPLPNTIDPQASPLEIQMGDAKATFVAGWNKWPYGQERGAKMSAAEDRNVISIVVKFTYAGKSVLFTGDTVGRVLKDTDPKACRYAEKWMVEKGNVKLKSDVLIGEHHGAENSSSECFIKAVQPEYIVYPAGHAHEHPRASAAERAIATLTKDPAYPNTADRILRTDRGDDDNEDHDNKEWDYGRVAGCTDKTGDDDIEIIIPGDPKKKMIVRYRQEAKPCMP